MRGIYGHVVEPRCLRDQEYVDIKEAKTYEVQIYPALLHLNTYSKCEILIHAVRIIPPPMWYCNYFASTKEEKGQQHVKIKPGVKGGSKNIVIPRPQHVFISVSPEHNKSTNNTRRIAGANVAVEVRQATKKDSNIEKIEFCARKESMEEIHEGGTGSADEEAVRERAVERQLEEALGTLRANSLVSQATAKMEQPQLTTRTYCTLVVSAVAKVRPVY